MVYLHHNKGFVRLICVLGVAIFLLLASSALADNKTSAGSNDERTEKNQPGAILSVSCTACHGSGKTGISVGPNILGIKANELEQILKDVRDGNRPASLMSRQAKQYSDSEIKLIAGHIAQQ